MNHEGGEGAVEGRGIVGAGGTESEEILERCGAFSDGCRSDCHDGCLCRGLDGVGCPHLCCFGDGFTKDFDLDVAGGGVQCHRHGW